MEQATVVRLSTPVQGVDYDDRRGLRRRPGCINDCSKQTDAKISAREHKLTSTWFMTL